MGTPATMSPAQQAYLQNKNAGDLIRANAVPMTQQIFSQTINPANGNQINVIPRNVGLILGFWVELAVTVANTDGALTLSLTDANIANLLSNITFIDLQNNTRINTVGRHVEFVNSVKNRRVMGSSLVYSTGFDTPIKYGSNWSPITAPATIANGVTSAAIKMMYWIPLAYSDTDYRGAVFANVVNATMALNLTVNPNAIVAAGVDQTNAVYAGAAGAITSVTCTVYQKYLDQLPIASNGAFVLPNLDLRTIYELKNTTLTAITPGNDFPVQYPNFRDFLSTTVEYVSATAGTRGVGADINYWGLQTANLTFQWKIDPQLSALQTRQILGSDGWRGLYYFSSRLKPIATTQYGNMQLVLNAITAGAGAYMNVFWEDFGMLNTLPGASSLPAS